MLLKLKNSFSGQILRYTKKILNNEIVRFKKIDKSYFNHFLIKGTVFVIIVINTIKNKKFNIF